MSAVSRVVVFGGQGSRAIFAPSTITSLCKALSRSASASLFLSKCHAAFLEAIESFDEPTRSAVGLDPLYFHSAKNLLDPAGRYQCHGVVQAAALFVNQMIQFISVVDDNKSSCHAYLDSIFEATGFCAGLLPAVAASCSRSPDQLIDVGVELFRLCFWIACRSLLHGSKHEESRWNKQATWSLAIVGCTEEEIFSAITSFESKTGTRSVRVSAVSAAESISVSGLPSDLNEFKGFLPQTARSTFLFINSWYHGGDQLSEVLSAVNSDIQDRCIRIPLSSELRLPLRSTYDGHIFNNKGPPTSLGVWVTQHMIIHSVRWQHISDAIINSCQTRLHNEPDAMIAVENFGPGSSSLLSNLKTLSIPRLLTVDRNTTAASQNLNSYQQDGIAIVGMGINLPGAENTESFTTMLLGCLDAVREIPQDRFDLSSFQAGTDSSHKRQMNARHGAFLDDIWTFDNEFFSVSPREALSMDPQQRVLLHIVQSALDDAGYVPDSTPSFDRKSIGCFMGLATGDYTDNLREDLDVFYSPGTLRAFHSGRISHFYKLSGPCMTIDTACSSSMVAINQAVRTLQAGDCNCAITGGVNIICSPDMYLGLDKGHFLSSTGGCKPFDANADGYCRAEGGAVFVLKRLSDALADNDRIHGVIRDVATNQSGNSHSITHPHSETQIDLLNGLLRRTGVQPESVSVVEAHGTGTQAGDLRESESLAQVFANPSISKRTPLIVSSVKGNIGHTEAASGAAGLAKLLVMLRNKQIFPQAGLKTLNPKISALHNGTIRIPSKVETWDHAASLPRRAVLNNFGAAGSNSTLLLEETFSSPHTAVVYSARSSYVFTLSAKSPDAFSQLARDYSHHIEQGDLNLKDICYTATARRQSYKHSVAIPASSKTELVEKLQAIDLPELSKLSNKPRNCVFVFSGQGAISPGMAKELMSTSRDFASSVHLCNQIVIGLGFPCLLSYLSGDQQSYLSPLDEIIVSQCACVALQFALAQLLITWGVSPGCVVGHSLGEYAALAVSGSLSIESAMTIVARRAKLMAQRCGVPKLTGMVAVTLPSDGARQIIVSHGGMKGLEIACENSPYDCVVAGLASRLDVFESVCREASIKFRRLDVPYGFHSSAMDPILSELEDACSTVQWSTPSIPFFSSLLGRRVEKKSNFVAEGAKYLSQHARCPVIFDQAIKSIASLELFQNSAWVEIGSHPITIPLVRSTVSGRNFFGIPSLHRAKQPWVSLCKMLCDLSNSTSIAIKWRNVFSHSNVKLVDLPSHPLLGSRYAITYKEPSQTPASAKLESGFLQTQSQLLPQMKKAAGRTIFKTPIHTLGSLIAGHNVGGTPICPASVYWALVRESSHLALGPSADGNLAVIEDVTYASPLIYIPSEEDKLIEVSISDLNEENLANFAINTNKSDSKATRHCYGQVRLRSRDRVCKEWVKDTALVKRQTRYLQNENPERLSRFQTRLLYNVVFPRVVQYSEEYQSLTDFCVSDMSMEGVGSFILPHDAKSKLDQSEFIRWTDILLHAAGFIANISVASDEICICTWLGSGTVDTEAISFNDKFSIYCSLVETDKNTFLGDSHVLDKNGQIVAQVRSSQFKRLKRTNFERVLSTSVAVPSNASDDTDNEDGQVSEGLATPDSHEIIRMDSEMQGQVDQIILSTVSSVSGIDIKHLQREVPLQDLGIDSMMQIEIVEKLKQSLPVAGLDHGLLDECDTVASLIDRIAQTTRTVNTATISDIPSEASSVSLSDSETSSNSSCSSTTSDETNRVDLITLQVATDKRTPLFLIPDGSGTVKPYARLQSLGRDLNAMFDPNVCDVKSSANFQSIEEMASAYASKISSFTAGPIILGGWSFGGVVALEVACQLRSSGHDVRGLILIDSPLPIDHEPLPLAIIKHVLRGSRSNSIPSPALIQRFQHAAGLLSRYKPRREASSLKTVILNCTELLDTQRECGVEYPWLSDHQTRMAALEAWSGLLKEEVQVLPIPGNHFQAFDADNIAKMTEQLCLACNYLET